MISLEGQRTRSGYLSIRSKMKEPIIIADNSLPLVYRITASFFVEASQHLFKLTHLCFRFEIQARLFVLTRLEKKELKWIEWDCILVMEWEEIRSGAHSICNILGIGLGLAHN